MENIFDKIRAALPGGGELALEAMDEYQLLEIGRKTYDILTCQNVSCRNGRANRTAQ